MTSKVPQNYSSSKQLSGKKLLLYITILVCIFTATAVSIIQLNNIVIGGSDYKTIKSSTDAIENVAQIHSNLHQIINEVRPIMHDADKGSAITVARLLSLDIDRRFVNLQELIKTPGRRESVVKADTIWKEYKKTLLEEIIPAAGKGDKLKIAYLTTGIQAQRYNSLNKTTASLTSNLRQDIVVMEQRAVSDQTIKIAIMALLTCIALSLIVYFSLILSNNFNKSLQPSIKHLKELSNGNLDAPLPANNTVKSAELHDSINLMTGRFRQTITSATKISDELNKIGTSLIKTSADGAGGATDFEPALSRLSESTESIIKFSDTFTGALENLSSSVEKNTATAGQLVSSCREIGIQSEQLGEQVRHIGTAASEICSSTDQFSSALSDLQCTADGTSASILQLDAAISQAETSARNTSAISEALQQDAEIGREAAAETISAIKAIRNSSRLTTEAVETLSLRASDIDNIISEIDELAEQASLLALNATIVATQAGEQGNSFTVVAGEIKELSERTSSSTRAISTLIREIQQETRRAAEAIIQVEANLIDGEQLSQRSGMALNLIASGIQQACIQYREIAGITTGQAQKSLAVKESFDCVTTLVEQTTKLSEKQSGNGEAMAVFAVDLHQSVAELVSLAQKLNSSNQITELSGEIALLKKEVDQAAATIKENCSTIAECTCEIKATTAPAVTYVASTENDIIELNRQIERLKCELSSYKL